MPSSSAFKARFDELSGGLLNGLDWNNVFVAGGIVLGALYSVTSPLSSVKGQDFKSSDIDIYIYGLDSNAATEKIKHIFQVYRKNLVHTARTLVVRNSKTITFYSKYPTRHIQIVLRFLKTPKEVLLNFDLDICAMGWDGSTAWMLPRAARALETGFNVFTMSLIQGHYLSERRATQEERVFKYAYRGYGIRILPSYIASLEDSKCELDSIARGEDLLPLDIDYLADRSRQWTKRIIVASHSLRGRPTGPIHCRTSDLDNGAQTSSEPQEHSSLSGFSLFMRYVALWEMERRGEVVMKSRVWAMASYAEDSPLAYDDTPYYSWDEKFDLVNFSTAIDEFNRRQITGWMQDSKDVADLDFSALGYDAHWSEDGNPHPILENLRRISYAPNAEEVLKAEADITMPIILPRTLPNSQTSLFR
ncbi:hypothetical protein C8F01DRAFT_33937 [Mycena amicta]|nr:hypothetical protein C8F01DRAFT_33937 [Mycena amicta]